MCQKKYNINIKEKKYQHINFNERTQIERWYNKDKRSCSEIAKLLNKSVRTIQREIKRGLVDNLTADWEVIYVYSADVAQSKYDYNIHAKGPDIKLGKDHELAKYIEDGIKKDKKSPEILIADIDKYGLKFKNKVCAKTIRNCIHKGILNLKQKDMIYKKEYKEKNKEKYTFIKIPAEMSIDFRPKEVETREEYGHWEGDLVVGKNNKGAALFTLTERKTREEIIVKVPNKKTKTIVKALDDIEKKYKKVFKEKFKSITFDNGVEFRDYEGLQRSYDKRKKGKRIDIYYAHPYRSCERGTNENNNRLIRRFIPKGTVITKLSDEFIKEVEDWINNLSRPMFNFKSSLELVEINI